MWPIIFQILQFTMVAYAPPGQTVKLTLSRWQAFTLYTHIQSKLSNKCTRTEDRNERSLAFEVIRPSTQLFMLQCLFPQIFLQIHFIAFTRLLLHCKRWSTQPPCLQISALISHSQISPSRPAPAVLAEFYPHRAIRLWQIQNAIINWFLLL